MDDVSLKEASELFRETGHPVTAPTLKRWCERNGVAVVRKGSADYASWSALLKLHAAAVDRRSGG